MQEFNFDIYRDRKVVFKGITYPVRAVTAKEEAGIVRGFRIRYKELIDKAKAVSTTDKQAVRDHRAAEITLMVEVITTFCDIDATTLLQMPTLSFYELHAFALGGDLRDGMLDADKYAVCAQAIHDGQKYDIATPGVGDMIKILDIADERLTPSIASTDGDGEVAAVLDIVEPYIDLDREVLERQPIDALRRIVGAIILSIRGIVDGDEKNA